MVNLVHFLEVNCNTPRMLVSIKFGWNSLWLPCVALSFELLPSSLKLLVLLTYIPFVQIKYFDSNITRNLAAGINLEKQHLIKHIFHLLIFMNFITSILWYHFPQPMPMQPPLTIFVRRQLSRIPALLMLCGTDLNSSTPMNLSPIKNWMCLIWPGNNDGRPYNINERVSSQKNKSYHSYQRVQTTSCDPSLWNLWWHT